MRFNADKILREWSWRVGNGMPDASDDSHLTSLMEVLYEQNYSFAFIKELISNLTEKEKMVPNPNPKARKKMVTKSYADSFYEKNPEAKREKEKADRSKGGEIETPTTKAKKVDKKADSKKGSKDDTPTKTAPQDKDILPADDLIKYMDGRYGIDSKVEKALEKFPNKFGEAEKAKVKALENDFKEFMKNPTEEGAKAMVDQYKLSTNQGGNKLYLGFVVGDGRKLLGETGKLSKSMVAMIEKQLPNFRQAGDPIKAAKQAVTTTSKPDISGAPSDDTPITYINSKGEEVTTTAGKARKKKRGHPAKNAYLKETSISTADNDPTVKEIFNKDPFNYLEPSMHEVFGPKGEDGKILDNKGGQNAEAYFKQSIENNTALKATMSKLEELEAQGNASPEVRKALKEHETNLAELAKNFNSMSPEEREKAVQDSYANMAQKMATADPEMTNAIFKNVAEMALYDSEIAGGKEAYLPSAGTFPSGDKIRIDRDGNGVVEKIAAVSCKFGKSNSGTYGFPGETQQYIKFHPDPSKRDQLNNRAGSPGYTMGVKDNVIEDPKEFNKIMDESGIGPAVKNPEKVRAALLDAKNKMDAARKKFDDKGPPHPTVADLVSIRSELEAINKETSSVLEENIDKKKLHEVVGGKYDEKTGKMSGNMSTFFEGGAHAISMMTFGAALATSNGLDTIEHHHQVIDNDGLHMETTQGSPSMRDWNLTHRMFDSRGGGIIAGSTGPGEKK